jgi:hypothetical protein
MSIKSRKQTIKEQQSRALFPVPSSLVLIWYAEMIK